MHASRDDKLALFSDKAARDALNAKAQSPDNPLRMLADWGSKIIFDVVAPENEQYRGQTVSAIAAAEGRDAWDVLCDIAVADELAGAHDQVLFAVLDAFAEWPRRGKVDDAHAAARPHVDIHAVQPGAFIRAARADGPDLARRQGARGMGGSGAAQQREGRQ